MGYVAVKGGTDAIEASLKRLRYERLKGQEVLEIHTILTTMRSLIDQVMSEASLYEPTLAALPLNKLKGVWRRLYFYFEPTALHYQDYTIVKQ